MVNYVVLDPTKNITVLVTDNVPKEERGAVTKEIFAAEPDCEQVAYLTEPELGGFATDRIDMMGGEFCGNATLGLAAYVARRDGITEPCDVEVECSGFDKVITCRIKPLGKADANHKYEGTIEMPVPTKIEYCDSHPVIFLPGIAHMIMPADRFSHRQVENNIRDYAGRYDVEAFGILLWDEAEQFMTPCVYVKGSDTVVWEKGCATGSTCIGWHRYKDAGEKITEVHQPGGMIRLEVQAGRPYMTGTVVV